MTYKNWEIKAKQIINLNSYIYYIIIYHKHAYDLYGNVYKLLYHITLYAYIRKYIIC